MTIRNKLRATLVVLFVFIVGLVGLNFLTFAQLEGDSPAVNASGSLRMRAYQLAWLSASLVSADEAEAPHIRTAMFTRIEEYDRILKGLEKGDEELSLGAASDEKVLTQLHTLQPLWQTYRDDVCAVAEAADEGARSAANAEVAVAVDAYVNNVDKLVMAFDNASQAKIAVSKKIEIAVIVVAFLIFAGSSYLVITQILHPLAAITASFREVAGKEADLTQQLQAERYDEIGRIVHSFNSFVSDLRHLVQRAREYSTEVSGLSDTVWQASIENSKAVEYNAVAVTSLAGHTNEQNNDIQQLAASIAGLSKRMNEMQEYAQADEPDRAALAASIEAARRDAQTAADASGETAKTAQEIAELTQDSAAAIEQQTASLEAFAATAEQLKGLAAKLDRLVGRFKV